MNGIIQSISIPGTTWESKHGTMFNIDIVLQNGTKGQASAKSNEPWYSQPGTQIVYEATENEHGYTKLKISKPEGHENQGGGSSSGQSTASSQASSGTSTAHRDFESQAGGLSFKDKTILAQVAFKGAIELESAGIKAGMIKSMRYGEVSRSTKQFLATMIFAITEADGDDADKRKAEEEEREEAVKQLQREVAADKLAKQNQNKPEPGPDGQAFDPSGIEEDVPF